MILHLSSDKPIQKICFDSIDAVFVAGTLPFCDYNWVLSIRKQCIQHHCLFLFLSTGPVFIKDGKSYTIPSDLQHSQALKAQIDYYPHQALFNRLAHSTFRSSFTLRKKEKAYLNEKGWDKIDEHAHAFIKERLSLAAPKNDGKQTPMHGHPIFLAQHATGCCCRGCLEKWHHIPKGQPLSSYQQDQIVSILLEWIVRQTRCSKS